MSDAALASIIVSIIGLIGTLVTVLVSSHNVKTDVSNKIDVKMAVIETRLDEVDKKVSEHNGYAKLFNENIPLLKYRLDQLEKDNHEGP